MKFTGSIMGYDPGGNSKHGVAIFSYKNGTLTSHEIHTMATAYEIIEHTKKYSNIIAIGIDTLTCWSTGDSGWRPADRWLKSQYHNRTNSVVSANSLFGSMGINGMSVLISMRENNPDIHITETHPKVLYYALANKHYDYSINHVTMDTLLSNMLETKITTKNDHEWDAVISVYSALKGILGEWKTDLHQINLLQNEELITPCGKTNYWWPE